MPRVELLGGAYTAPDILAGAQECINLYPEQNPEYAQSPTKITHYLRAGETQLSLPPNPGRGRMLYAATNGDLFAVVDQNVFFINADYVWTQIGTLVNDITTPVYAADNGTDAIIVDGTVNGYDIHLSTHGFTQIGDPNFLGADRVDFLDGFLIFNQPGTPNWYCTNVYSTAFNALSFGTKSAWPDPMVALIAVERQAWLFGKYKGEVWVNAGTFPFPFQAVSSNIVEHGCAAKYSLTKQDTFIYWLSSSPEGNLMVMKGAGGIATRISTHAIEAEFKSYARFDDAIGVCEQMLGHAFYKLHFPTQDVTWVWDEATQLWHRQAYSDINGNFHRRRGMFTAYAYGASLMLDWNTGALYLNDPTNFTDNGAIVVRRRTMPHLIDQNYDRVTYWRLIADVDPGEGINLSQAALTTSPWSSGFSAGFGPRVNMFPPYMSLRVSHDRGHRWSGKITQLMGATGYYNEQITWRRLGPGKDVVFELEWAVNAKTALNGVFIDVEPHRLDSAFRQ